MRSNVETVLVAVSKLPTKGTDVLCPRLYLQEWEVLLPIIIVRWKSDVGRCCRLGLLAVHPSELQLYSMVPHLVPQRMAVAVIARSVPGGGWKVKIFIGFTPASHPLSSSDYISDESCSSGLCSCKRLQFVEVLFQLLLLPVRHRGILVTIVPGLPNQCGSLRHHLDAG
jgi:hypothetical protein